MQKQNPTRKIGAIVPSDGTIPYEIIDDRFMNKWLADRNFENTEYISVRSLGGKDISAATEFESCERATAEDVLSPAARKLGNMGCGSVIWACTSASFFKGLQHAKRQIQFLSESAQAPASSTAMAFLAALAALGAKRVDILSLYDSQTTKLLVTFLSEAGVSVGKIRNMYTQSGQGNDVDCGAELAEFASLMPISDDPILIPCTGINSLEHLESFEKISGRLVMTANQVTLWHALVLAGLISSTADPRSTLRLYAQ
ncbi:MAG: hypothetical protein EOS20_33635 [Mesorhizobium sp.]|uniref:aspartate racemase/maleate isomerase family protein n=1 Tax=unclassified Mesorhizobium TaxID=325217 RepID=UPI000FD2F6E9|nr:MULTISPECIES: hypothetical protein [unclassified Mesorhizobium]TGU88426.1 hypothetical protein EN794_049010 [Mesorhizobium sp. M00.F.Ca.ET.151.01.1.1]TGV56088.1 hypothetical protein EN784_27670 [bacterium M00.F.Ca.ET.141.01.1.1]RUW81129.1 hypothetical protein EOA28_02355 [Mesorhizobium sp. M2A.F.Ca.ET.067.02.1.1]RWB85638.1 MAG: hypothetical protein EOQ51_15675 [Mesorhizobium sp.]RWD77118.1 MAG: hypothetical protein EOS60_01330 [Mesorhizobium sp.]